MNPVKWRHRWGRSAIVAAVGLAALTLLIHAFLGINMGAVFGAVLRVGPIWPLLLIPWILGVSLDAAGMGVLLRVLGFPVRLARLVPIRVATEALHVTAPAGFLVADSACAALLALRCNVPWAEGAVLAVARKWLVMRAHAAYIALGAIAGAGVLGAVSHRSLGGGWLPWAVGASALVPLLLSVGLGACFRHRSPLVRLRRVIARLPWPALQAKVATWSEGASTGDVSLSRIGRAGGATWRAAAAFFCCWLCEALDTLVILRALGAPFDLALALSAEVAISMVRSIGNVMPAGLGIQDAGYFSLLSAMGIAPETAAAFVLLKRAKDLFWIGAGYTLLAHLRRPGRRSDDRSDEPALANAAQRAPGIVPG